MPPPPGKPPIRNVPVQEYGGQYQNWGVFQGGDGLVYVAGGSSLLTFDGVAWQRHPLPHRTRIRSFLPDDSDRLWIGSEAELGYFERNDRGTLAYRSLLDPDDPLREGVSDIRGVHRIDGAVYFRALERLFRWRDGRLVTLDPGPDDLFRLSFVHQGHLYLVTRKSILRVVDFDAGLDGLEPADHWSVAAPERLTFLTPWDPDTLLVGIYDRGVFQVREGQLLPFHVEDPGFNAAWPYAASRLADGSWIVTTIREGVYHLAADGRHLEHFDTDSGLLVDSTLGVSPDREGGIWLAQEGAIARIDLGTPVRRYDGDFGVENAKAIANHQGRWVLATGIGIGLLEASGDSASAFRPIESSVIDAFDLYSNDDELLVAGYGGVVRMTLDPETGEVAESEVLLEDSYAYGFFPLDGGQRVYVGSSRGLGILDRRADGTWSGAWARGIEQRVESVAEAADGSVWAGTGVGELHQLQWAEGELVRQRSLGPEAGVPAGNAQVFRVGTRLIFGTTEGGFRLDPENPGRVQPDPDFGNEQLPEPRDVFRLFSPDGRLVIAAIGASEGALYVGQVPDAGPIAWDGAPLAALDPGYVATFSHIDDRLWFSLGGAIYRTDFDSLLAMEPVSPPLNIRAAGYPETGDWRMQGRQDDIALGELEFTNDALRFQYALAGHARPADNRYRYRLLGLSPEWSAWTDETRRDFTRLAGGDYTFEVQGRDARGMESTVQRVRFTVLPPWYLSPAAWAAYILLGALALTGAALLGQRIRTRRLLENQLRLENEVAERTRTVRAQARELRELNEARLRFFANVSHEFRTPLTLTRGPLEELRAGRLGELPDEARAHVEMALRNTETMEALIGQVLDIQRLEAGRMPLQIVDGDLAGLTHDIVERLRPMARHKNIRLLPRGLNAPCPARFDPEALDKVIGNLVSNAIKFTPEAGTIGIACEGDDDGVTVTVSDTGPGIAEADRERVFERYVQGDATSPDQPGTGIGLALVRELVELHQGQVDLADADGGGCRFTVRLPRDLPPTEPGAAPDAEVDAFDRDQVGAEVNWIEPAGRAGDEAPLVLIVDDNAELRAFLRVRLKANYRVIEAEDGEAALTLVREALPDVVVADVMMPKMDGMALAEAIKSDPDVDFIPILLLTARSTRRDVVEGLRRGADDYLTKPFDTSELVARVAGLIASRRQLKLRFGAEHAAEPDHGESEFVGKARRALAEHLDDPEFGIADWAGLLHMDRTTLYRRLKAEADRTPEAFIREARLEAAAELLRRRAGNVAQVADAVGFASVSHFSQRFRERFGATPARFARKDAN